MTWLVDARCWNGDGSHSVKIPVEGRKVFLACAVQLDCFPLSVAARGATETGQKTWTSESLCRVFLARRALLV